MRNIGEKSANKRFHREANGMDQINSTSELFRGLNPTWNQGIYVYASLPLNSDIALLYPLATFREVEGLTVIVEESVAIRAALKILFRAAWITLQVNSDLAAIGLTAAVSTALARENIPCNIMAAAHHDHLFVPIEDGQRALQVLQDLQAQAQS